MQIDFYKSDSLTAVNSYIDETMHVGILILPPFSNELQEIQGHKFHLTTDLINKNQVRVALENDFVLHSDE